MSWPRKRRRSPGCLAVIFDQISSSLRDPRVLTRCHLSADLSDPTPGCYLI